MTTPTPTPPTPLEHALILTRSIRPTTKEDYLRSLRAFLSYAGENPIDWTPLKLEQWIQSQIDSKVDPRTVNKRLNALKTASRRYAALYSAPDFAKAIERFPVEHLERAAVRRSLSVEESKRLIDSCPLKGTVADKRDRAILLLALKGGLRRREITLVDWKDLAKNKLIVHGKGGYHEPVYLDQTILEAVAAWRVVFPDPVNEATPMFCKLQPILANGKPHKRLSHEGIYKIIRERAAVAGVANLSPHTLRHTCATLLQLAGVPSWRISKHLRHHGGSGDGAAPMTANYVHDLESEEGKPPTEVLDL